MDKGFKDLNFKFISPFSIEIKGEKKEAFAFLPEYGSINGLIICLLGEPDNRTDKDISEWSHLNRCYCSHINIEGYLNYKKELFIDTLND